MKHGVWSMKKKKESQGIASMRHTLALTISLLNHQNLYLDVNKSYPNRIELWMNSTCNLLMLLCVTWEIVTH